MNILFSTKDMKNIISSMEDIPYKYSLFHRCFSRIVEGFPRDYPKKHRIDKTFTWFDRLIDGSYGQFVLSKEKDVLVCSLGDIQVFDRENLPFYGNSIRIFAAVGRYKAWQYVNSAVVEDWYREDIAFAPDTVRRITALTKVYMKKFAACIDSIDRVDSLAEFIKSKQK